MVTLKSPAELERMRAAGHIVAEALDAASAHAKPGMTLRELDEIATAIIRDAGATPSFLGYQPTFTLNAYPAVLCTSLNDVIVHGIPDETVLRDGDVLSLDCGAIVAGYHGDSARTLVVGEGDSAAHHLISATERAFWAAVEDLVPGGRLSDVSHAVQRVGRSFGYGIPEYLGGHGIGTAMHEDPHLPNLGRPGRGLQIREGLVVAIEPMFLESGADEYHLLPDLWAEATDDGSRAAHHEHTVAVTADGPLVLTAR